jgi:hypothetical protein
MPKQKQEYINIIEIFKKMTYNKKKKLDISFTISQIN